MYQLENLVTKSGAPGVRHPEVEISPLQDSQSHDMTKQGQGYDVRVIR